MLFRQQHQILGCAHQELVITGGTFQSGTGIGAKAVQLGTDSGNQTADRIVIVILNGFQLSKGDLTVLKFPSGLSVLNQSIVVHKCASLNFSVQVLSDCIIKKQTPTFRDEITKKRIFSKGGSVWETVFAVAYKIFTILLCTLPWIPIIIKE
jgi:hypothetical protein